MSLKIKINYSPNFDLKKRKKTNIDFLIFHYTGMKYEKDAIKKLTSPKSKVSCHYFVKKNGEILNLVPDLYVAWHAGISRWKNYISLNKNSIGIEISNSGHNFNYDNFKKNQINSVYKLSKFLIRKYKIKNKNILGHSDIAPERKKDPGEKFPWKYLSKKKIGYWHNLNQRVLSKSRYLIIDKYDQKKFLKNIHKIGYPKNNLVKKSKYLKILSIAFQRRFRQELVNGIIDKECLKISENLLKK
jgi:N-acetylmuramoyl-L-alanine amidase|tara:strand:+ start:44 stop:775 length:732 start_codon:yes stop_codon:yes gene_type:complete